MEKQEKRAEGAQTMTLYQFAEKTYPSLNTFRHNGRTYVWCGYAEGLLDKIASYVIYDVEKKRYSYISKPRQYMVEEVSLVQTPLATTKAAIRSQPDFVSYKGVAYPLRQVEDREGDLLTIATNDLWDALDPTSGEKPMGSAEQDIDDMVFFYVCREIFDTYDDASLLDFIRQQVPELTI